MNQTRVLIKKHSLKKRSFTGSKGVTLIELLVSVFIGLLLLEGFTRYYTDQRVTNKLIGQELAIQQKSRLMLGFFKGFIEQAGYQPRDSIGMAYTNVFPATTQLNAGEYFRVIPEDTNSEIRVRYHHETGVRAQDCAGNTLDQPVILEQRIFLENRTLFCEVTAFSPSGGTQLFNQTQALFSEVAMFRATQIGVAPSTSGFVRVDTGTVAANGFEPSTLMVEVAISSEDFYYPQAQSQRFSLLDGTDQVFRSLKKFVYSKAVVNLRNQQ